jgi:hypothetical protein
MRLGLGKREIMEKGGGYGRKQDSKGKMRKKTKKKNYRL